MNSAFNTGNGYSATTKKELASSVEQAGRRLDLRA